MNDLERSGFEKMIHEDPELHDEVEFQQATIEAIKRQRMIALKAGLNQVPVSLWTLSLTEAAKIGAIAAGIGLASIGVYFGYEQLRKPADEKAAQQQIQNQKIENTTNPENGASGNQEETPEPGPAQDFQSNKNFQDASGTREIKPERPAIESSKKGSEQIPADNKNIRDSEVNEPGTQSLRLPQTQDITLPEDGITKNTSLESIHPEIVFKKNNRENFHYQFSDSKLVLYADFKDKLYEVLELNQSGSKQLFLAYNGKFFQLDPNQTDITPLKEVAEPGLTRVLNEYQNRRN
jgi:hypothetical protein